MTWNYTATQGVDSSNSDNYTAVITLAEVQHDVLYNVNITPDALDIHCSGNSTFILTLSYGSAYYVVVMATSALCRSDVSSSTVLGWINVNYARTVETMYGE